MLPVPSATVVFQRIDDGAVLFAPATEIYFGLNEVGAKIWELLPPKSESLDQLCTTLAAAYPSVPAAELRSDVEELLTQLVQEGLLAPPSTGAADEQPRA